MGKISKLIETSKNKIFEIHYKYRCGNLTDEEMIEMIKCEIGFCEGEILDLIEECLPEKYEDIEDYERNDAEIRWDNAIKNMEKNLKELRGEQ